MPDEMTVRAASEVLGVHENTIRNWMREGHLEYLELPSGFRRPTVQGVQRLLNARSPRRPPTTMPVGGVSWRDGLAMLERLIAQEEAVSAAAIREIIEAIWEYEDDVDESIRSALWEEAVANGEEWADE